MEESELKKLIHESIIYGDFLTTDFKPTKFYIYLKNIMNKNEFKKLILEEMIEKSMLDEITAFAGLSWISSSMLLAKFLAENEQKSFTIIDYPIYPPLGCVCDLLKWDPPSH